MKKIFNNTYQYTKDEFNKYWTNIFSQYKKWSEDLNQETQLLFDFWIHLKADDKYDKFINSIIENQDQYLVWPVFPEKVEKIKQFLETQQIFDLEIHHIKPIFLKGEKNDPNNKILLTSDFHTFAHILHFQNFGYRGDYFSLNLRLCRTDNHAKIIGQQNAEANRKNKIGFFNSDFQSQQGKKGGIIGGLKKSEKQQTARSKLGKKFGQKVGLTKQTEKSKSFLTKELIFQHDSGIIVNILPNSLVSIQQINFLLNKTVAGSVTSTNVPNRLLNGERKKLSGWIVLKGALEKK